VAENNLTRTTHKNQRALYCNFGQTHDNNHPQFEPTLLRGGEQEELPCTNHPKYKPHQIHRPSDPSAI